MDETAGLVDDEEVERCHLASSSCCLIGWLGWSEESRVESSSPNEQVVSPRGAERGIFGFWRVYFSPLEAGSRTCSRGL